MLFFCFSQPGWVNPQKDDQQATLWDCCVTVNIILYSLLFTSFSRPSDFPGLVVVSSPLSLCVLENHLYMLLQIHCPRFTSGLMMPPSVSPLLAMRRTGFASAPRSTRAGCASSAPASATPAVTERRASRSHRWRPCASAPMAGRVSCVKSVSVTDQCRA